MRVEVVLADLQRPDHQEAIVALTDVYARDEMGNGRPLAPEVRARLIPGLQALPTTRIFLAYDEGRPVGIATCFVGFSTFAARPLLNVHDLAVLPSHRKRGVGRELLAAAERYARAEGFCKLTLEVQENNLRARGVYAAAGFAQAAYVPGTGGSLFCTKDLLG